MNYEAHFYNLDLISERRASAVILFSNTNKGDRNLKKKKRWGGIRVRPHSVVSVMRVRVLIFFI